MKKVFEVHGATKTETKIKAGFIGQRMIVLPKNILSTIKKNPLINQLYITDIGFFPRAKRHFRKRKQGSRQFILIYCLEGRGIIDFKDSKIELTPNFYFIIPPCTEHSYYADQKDPWSIYWIHFTGSQSVNLYQKFSRYNSVSSRNVSFEERRVNLFESLMDVLEDGYSSDNIEYVNITLWQVLGSFIFNSYFTEIGKENVEGDIINTSIRYMKDHLDKPLKVDAIASNFHYSNSHFFALFRKKTGYSPIHYFNHLKIQKACQYLSFTDMSVKEISFAMGYEDPLYFSRLFKKTMTISPLQYRKEYKD